MCGMNTFCKQGRGGREERAGGSGAVNSLIGCFGGWCVEKAVWNICAWEAWAACSHD